MPYTQDDRLLQLSTNAGKDVLLLDTLACKEAISTPFRIEMHMASEIATGNPDKVKPHNLVGTSMSVRLALTAPDTGDVSGARYWTGMCERFVQEDTDDNFAYFSAVLVPWFSFLKYNYNCRIFQDKNVTDIVQEVVSAYGYSSQLEVHTAKTYATRSYCVQYNESDFAFISRILESEGIYYYFEHTDGNHVMILADAVSQYETMPHVTGPIKYSPLTGLQPTEDTIRSWRVEEGMHTGKYTIRDFHHESPTNFFEQSNPSNDVATEGKKFEIFEFPGGAAKKFNAVGSGGKVFPEAENLSRVDIEKEETYHTIYSGTSKSKVMATGYKFDVTGGFAAGSYLLTEARHDANQSPSYVHLVMARNPYKNSFRAIPSSRLFVPSVRPHPGMPSLQTAFVIDETPSGNSEEIWPDKYGRVRVRFHWDREAKFACWLRVVQPWAGKLWGQQWIPRVGDEVAVTYLEGDPDCPVVVGSIYNSDNMPIFTLPDNKTQSGIQTHSSTGGGSANFNMLRFEDKMGDEEIFMQAEKDQNVLIKHNETHTVKNNRTTTIHVDDTRTVETGNDTLTVQQGNRKITVSQGTITEYAQGQISVESAAGITLKCGPSSIEMTPSGITLTIGGSSISMTSGATAHSAPMITLNS